jgi:hypothetical protein
MRNKIIAVNAVIVLIVGLLAFAIVRTSLGVATGSPDALKKRAETDAEAAAAKLQRDALVLERWLIGAATEAPVRAVMSKATQEAKGDSATQACDGVVSAAKTAFGARAPSIVAMVDNSGKIIGRNGSNLARGEDVASAYPAFKEALKSGRGGSDVWSDKARADQYLVAYAPVRDEQGQPAGAIYAGVPLADSLSRVSEGASGQGLLLLTVSGDSIQVASTSTNTSEEVKTAISAATEPVMSALKAGNVVIGTQKDTAFAVAPLEAFGDGKRAALVAVAPTTLLEGANAASYSILGVMLLGIVMVLGGGVVLGNYISRPIQMLEEGLLAILNGQSDKRFELDHAELGGLAFRIDQLLNQLMGIEEDTTDDEGRVSKAPTAANFSDAMAVDRSGQQPAVDPARLAAEPADAYYARLYGEYMAAKRALGEQVDHITDAAFRSRIQGMEQDAASKQGRPVRYHVQTNGREVVLLAVPLG